MHEILQENMQTLVTNILHFSYNEIDYFLNMLYCNKMNYLQV